MAKYFPIVFGLMIGWFVTHPPAVLTSMGLKGYALAIGLASLTFVAFIAAQIRVGLPDQLRVEPYSESLPGGIKDLLSRLRSLGFEPDQAVTAHLTPPALVVPAYQQDSRCYAVVFRTGTVPEKIAFDFLSATLDDSHSLTTSGEVDGGAMPAEQTRFKQFFPKATVEELYQRHREALDFLEQKGLSFRSVGPGNFVSDLQKGIRRQRQHFLKSWLINTMITIARAVTGRNPHVGPVQNQPGVLKTLKSIGS